MMMESTFDLELKVGVTCCGSCDSFALYLLRLAGPPTASSCCQYSFSKTYLPHASDSLLSFLMAAISPKGRYPQDIGLFFFPTV
jgi:hypothetical protein